MIALGLLLVLVGAVLAMPRRSIPGSVSAARLIELAPGHLQRPADVDAVNTRRWNIIRIAMGLVVLAGGCVIIWFSS